MSAVRTEAGAPTSTGVTAGSAWRSARWPLAVLAGLVLAGLLLAVLRVPVGGPPLDPGSYAPAGGRALAALLEQGGVPVQVVGDLPALRAELSPGSTVLVPRPAALTDEELAEIGRLRARTVIVAAAPEEVEALGLPVRTTESDLAVREPDCAVPAAQRAGEALSGGFAYEPEPGAAAVGCYAERGRAGLLALAERDLTLVGAAAAFTNEELDQEGNAALTTGLLGAGDEVLWLVPRADRPLTGARRPLRSLLPDAVPLVAVQLVVAVALLALARARRLGPVVEEPLPVVVRGAETVEARSRLYRAAGARGTAAEALRAAARDRLARRLGLGPETDRAGLVTTAAARTGRSPADVDLLLYGPAPGDDASLVRLADALDALDALAPPTAARPAPAPPPAPAPRTPDQETEQ